MIQQMVSSHSSLWPVDTSYYLHNAQFTHIAVLIYRDIVILELKESNH